MNLTKEMLLRKHYRLSKFSHGIIHGSVKGVYLAMDEYAAQVLAEHEARQDHSIDDFNEKVDRMRGLYQNGFFTLADEVRHQLMNDLESVMMTPYKEGGEG